MIVVYGDTKGCMTCGLLKVYLKDSGVPHRFYELYEDFTFRELLDLYPEFDAFPFILRDGVEITLADIDKVVHDSNLKRKTRIQ